MNKFKILNTIKNRGKKILITCVPCIIILLVILILCFYGYYDSYDNEMIGYIVIFMPSFIFFVIYSYDNIILDFCRLIAKVLNSNIIHD